MDCKHTNVLSLSAKTADRCFIRWPNGETEDGYAPCVRGLGGGDYLTIRICTDCKTVLDLDVAAIQSLQDEALANKGPKPEW